MKLNIIYVNKYLVIFCKSKRCLFKKNLYDVSNLNAVNSHAEKNYGQPIMKYKRIISEIDL